MHLHSYHCSSSGIPGFDVVNLENLSQKTLTSEDLESGDKELWLIKVPYDVCRFYCCFLLLIVMVVPQPVFFSLGLKYTDTFI